jgi:hypothetical protein
MPSAIGSRGYAVQFAETTNAIDLHSRRVARAAARSGPKVATYPLVTTGGGALPLPTYCAQPAMLRRANEGVPSVRFARHDKGSYFRPRYVLLLAIISNR